MAISDPITNGESHANAATSPSAPVDSATSGASASASAPAAASIAEDNDEENDPLPELGDDDFDGDSALGTSDGSGGGTSLASSILAGQWSGGRRYQVTRENEGAFNMPSDEKQFYSMQAGHLSLTLVDSLRKNPYFRSPISKNAQRVIDLGTGAGGWASDVADMFPNLTVHGVDLYPPPHTWVAPNCIFEVDDISKRWTFPYKFDLVHIRLLLGALPREEWKKVYKQAYDNLNPGGWIEHTELEVDIGSLPANPFPEDSVLHTWKPYLMAASSNSGTAADNFEWMREEIEDAGFICVHQHDFKMPLGDWSQHPIWKEAGKLEMVKFREGLDGWVTWGLSKFGTPSPWSPEEITVWCALLRQELDKGYHIYENHRKVYAQKPFDTPTKAPEPVLENVEAPAKATAKD